MSTDLRAALAKIEAFGEFDAWSRTDEIIDAAIAVVAIWLRAEADRRRELADQPNGYTAVWEADAIDDLADSLAKTTGGTGHE